MALIDCIKVNADYESVLFRGKPAPAANHAIEFLAFYLQDLPVQTDLTYDDAFLKRVSELSGRHPRTAKKGPVQNWWGPLLDLERERWLNSKLTSTALAIENGWTRARILKKSELSQTRIDREMILKDPFGMSGRGLFSLAPGLDPRLPGTLPDELILEPKLERRFDFSHYVFPDGKVICYENIVDDRFQYRGTIVEQNPVISSLSFSHLISAQEWEKFDAAFKAIRDHYGETSYGYSVDSFVYEESGELRIYPLSEVNARRTMGCLAFEFSRQWRPHSRVALSLKKPLLTDPVKLSPDNSLFDIFLSFE